MIKRKLVRQGKSTLTISLPVDWIRKFNLTDGDEVEITEIGDSLEIGSEQKKEIQKIEINITKMDTGFVWREFMGIYRSGVDEVVVTHDKQLDLLNRIASQFIGYVITKQAGSQVTITDLGGLRKVEFKSLFRRLYFLTLDAFNVCQGFLESGKISEDMALLNINTNQLTDFCLRYLNKKGLADYRKTVAYSQIILNLEFLVDIIFSLSKRIPKMTKEDRKKMLLVHRKTTMFVREFYGKIFKFDRKSLNDLYKDIKILSSKMSVVKEKVGEYHYFQIISLLKDSISQIILINQEDYLKQQQGIF